MTIWNELSSHEKLAGLPAAIKRTVSSGGYRYSFVHDDVEIDDPSVDVTGRFFVSPREYGFSIRGFQGGKTAWVRDFDNGSMLVVNAEGLSHVLSSKVPSRILFVAADGSVLQDTGSLPRLQPRTADRVSVRLTINATFDLNGESPEVARHLLMRMVDHAILAGPMTGESRASLIEHSFEASAVFSDENTGYGNTDFSKLLDV
ncbi:hypothetical protein [Rhodoferax sp. UBA5149]|uniref:hypothetical protein n=1 Tax=Rhodoferax sp. UBA5149 TaxID=1947379 RepID=UPI0025ECB43D|nr:hypothetical protein [Rhodoferax sp. UBA5149]